MQSHNEHGERLPTDDKGLRPLDTVFQAATALDTNYFIIERLEDL